MPDPDIEVIEKALQALSEHFDTVHIFTTRYESEHEGRTICVNRGVGNWFARYGQVTNWLLEQQNEVEEDGD